MGKLIRYFDSISAADIGDVGGKGANLGVMTKAGFNVPPGFCVTTDAYEAFISPKEKELYAMLDGLRVDDLDRVRKVGAEVRKMLGRLSLPEDLKKPLDVAWRKNDAKCAYAIRSSATAEDLPQASFAGQQDTYLNIIGVEALEQSVKNCFISLFTDRAILYRVQNGFDHKDVALSVVVQKMILPEASGIMFTADPVNGKRNVISIDASFGIGEALVSGLVSADLYQIDKSSGEIIKKQIGDKKIAILPIEGGGTKTIDLDDERRHSATLSDKEILTLANVGMKIETLYGKPQDIEWAIADGEIYITQSRPITSLYPLPEGQEDAQKIYISFNHFQVMTDAMPPLSMSLFRSIVPVGRNEITGESDYVVPVGGRLYGEASNILNHKIGRKVFPILVGKADHLVGKILTGWIQNHPRRSTKIKISNILPIVLPVIWKTKSCLLFKKYYDFPNEMSRFMDDRVALVAANIDQASSTSEQLVICRNELKNLIHTIAPWRERLLASMFAMKLLANVMERRASSETLDSLMRGLEGNVTTEMDLALGDVADAARGHMKLTACLGDVEISWQKRIADCAKLPGGDEFLKQWDAFIAKYGARGPSEIDLYRPRWREDGSSLLAMVAGMLKSGKKGAHREHYQSLIDENHRANEKIIATAGNGFWGFIRAPFVRRMTYVIRNLFPLREHHKFLLIRLLDITKPVIKNAGQKMWKDGKTEHEDDVWFYSLPELHTGFENGDWIAKSEIIQRKRDFEHFQKMTPPRVITGEGEIPTASYDTEGAPEGALMGSPVSAGMVEGVVKVVLDPSVETLHPGEILIAPFTDPGWTPLFVNAAGLVTEVGGLMTHGSVIAREYGIPAVVGVIDATKIIQTGDRIRINGEAGYVEILESVDGEIS
ncbi:MAG: phosphoenolpyruvate synthase [Rhizobiaceae bacterium]